MQRSLVMVVAGLLALSLIGCSSTMPSTSSRSGLTGDRLRPEAMLAPSLSDGREDPARRIVQIEPDPERDEELHSLVRAALDDLRSGEIQPALDLLLAAQSVEGWMRSEHAPAILFWTGHSYDQLGERFAAMGAFRRISIQYPRSAFAERASRRLRELRSRAPLAQPPRR